MVYALTLAAPLVLLVLMLVMERVEQPLRRDAVGEQLVAFLDTARPEEVETYVSDGFAPALERYWSRRRSGVRPSPAPGRRTERRAGTDRRAESHRRPAPDRNGPARRSAAQDGLPAH